MTREAGDQFAKQYLEKLLKLKNIEINTKISDEDRELIMTVTNNQIFGFSEYLKNISKKHGLMLMRYKL
ncbi:MAG: hypothetical protein EAZ77_13975 [Nostocales cyanobacterium]|nr:MAG: hypothetical protein EAZ77_13975 [Nostocales cyanobacterium]